MILSSIKITDLSPDALDLVKDVEAFADKHIGSLVPQDYEKRSAIIGQLADGEEAIDTLLYYLVDFSILFPQLSREQLLGLVQLKDLHTHIHIGMTYAQNTGIDKQVGRLEVTAVTLVQNLNIDRSLLSEPQLEILDSLIAFA